MVKEEVAHITKYGSLIESIFNKLNDDFKTWKEPQSDQIIATKTQHMNY